MIQIKPKHFAQASVAVVALCFFAIHANDAESSAGPGENKPVVSDKRPAEKTRKPGEPITLHLDDVDVRRALELLSRQGSMNILVSPGVSGQVTANLLDVGLDDALDAILKLCNLVARREKNLIYVYTPQEALDANGRDSKQGTRVYRPNYVRATDLEKMITPFLSTDSGRIAVTPASAVGIGTNTDAAGGDSLAGGDALIVQDLESVLLSIDAIVKQLDVQPVQVLIEAVIMEVRLDDSTDLGVNFAVLDGAGRVLTTIGNGAEINASVGFDPAQILTAGGKLNGTSTTGFAADTAGLKFGFVDKDVTGFIRALETVGKTKVLACPRILVLNKQRAELIIGDKIGYKTLTVTETASVEKIEFLNVGTQLRLRPFVANDGMIRMEIHPERSSGEVTDGIPRTTTTEVTTNVIVPDSSTIVIGGLMEEETIEQQSGVPVLSRLRWVGPLFRQKFKSTTKKELIVLLTPRICNPHDPGNIPVDLSALKPIISTDVQPVQKPIAEPEVRPAQYAPAQLGLPEAIQATNIETSVRLCAPHPTAAIKSLSIVPRSQAHSSRQSVANDQRPSMPRVTTLRIIPKMNDSGTENVGSN
jgi:type IV pilus secretin PilQ/predicted competence protein